MHNKLLNLVEEIRISSFIKLFFTYQIITRILLTAYALLEKNILLKEIPGIFVFGFINDSVTSCYGLTFLLALRVLVLYFLENENFRRAFAFFSFVILNFIFLFNLLGEVVFWDEFSSRYNFIAVDYLIYTQEIIGTLRESVPVMPIILGIALFLLILVIFSRNYIRKTAENNKLGIHLFLSALIISFGAKYFYEPEKIMTFHNNFAKELSKNGMYEFVYAFFNNELDYKKFYPLVNDEVADQNVRNLIKQPGDEFIKEDGIERAVAGKSILKKQLKYPNYVVIVVESLSAEYLGIFGNSKNLTPYLDKIAQEGILFTKAYATGTRTVRGLEAVSKSIPPTPGSSILRRQGNENLFTVSSVLKPLGYNIDFVFGGYSYFDNMGYFFKNNGFKITDRNDFTKEEISFANVWGIADGDALKKLEKTLDERHAENKPFFSLFLTTSNHRPYTFPEGAIDMPQGKRDSVIRYTDFAIESFIESAKQKPWFDDTIFVIVADHCASSAGKTKLPVNKYHIPIIIYAPKLIDAQKIDYMVSQIDVIPTLLGLSGLNYTSNFYGMDALKSAPNRAFIGTYQLLGYLKDDDLVILAPNKEPILEGKGQNQQIIEQAISYYQNAYESFKKEQVKDSLGWKEKGDY